MDGLLKNHIVTELQPVLLTPLMDQLTYFGQVYALQMIHNSFTSYEAVVEIDPEENAVKMMGPYDPTESLARLIKQLEKGIEFLCAGGQTISGTMVVSKDITILAQTFTFNKYIR